MNVKDLHKVYFALVIAVGLIRAEDAIPEEDRPKYEYGYVISHKGGGSQAHLAARNGNMALGRYYVNFPDGSGQKITYLADDVGFHTGISYNSQTRGGSSRTQIAMGRKAMATLENLNAPRSSAKTKNTDISFGTENPQGLINTATDNSVTHPNANYKVFRGFYITKEPQETSITTTRNLESTSPSSPRSIEESNVEEIKENALKISHPSFENHPEKVEQNQIQSAAIPEIRSYISKSGSIPSENLSGNYQKDPQTSSTTTTAYYAEEKSIERTVFSDVETSLLSQIRKHAENIIMNDKRKEQQNLNLKSNVQKFSLTTQPVSTMVTMEPIVVVGDGETRNFVRSTLTPDVQKMADSVNSLKATQPTNGQHTPKKSDFVEDSSTSPSSATSSIKVGQETHQLIKADSTNRNSDNSTPCKSNLCERNNHREIFNGLSTIKPRKDIGSHSDISSGSNARKSNPTFYPQNELKEERHYVTTIDVQKGISLEVQQNEDGSIQLAEKFPFNKLTGHHRQHTVPTNSFNQIPSNSATENLFSPIQNLNAIPDLEKSFQSNVKIQPVQQINYSIHPQENVQFQVESAYQRPQSISSGILQDIYSSRDQINDGLKSTEATHLAGNRGNYQEKAKQFSHVADLEREKEIRKQNFDKEERKKFIENLKKVEEVKQQNSMTPRSEVDFQSNFVVQHVTPSSEISVETNSIETPQLKFNPEQYRYRFQLLPQVISTGYNRNELSDYGNEVPASQPNLQYASNSLIYQSRPNLVRQASPVHDASEAKNQFLFHPTSQPQNIQAEEDVQITAQAQNVQKIQLPQAEFESRPGFPQREQIEEKVEQGRQVALPQVQINPIPVHFEPRFLRPERIPVLEKGFLINEITPIDYHKAFGVDQPVSLIRSYPVQLQSGSEFGMSAFHHLPQDYQVPIQISQPAQFSVPYQGIPSSANGQFRVVTHYMGQNKLRVGPLKPSSPQEDSNAGSVQNLLPQQRFQPPNYYSNYPSYGRLQLRHIDRKKRPNFDQINSIRRGKNLNDLRLEYGFKPPLRPSVEFTEEVKPSKYGPSVPRR